ncbi:MAG: DAK2 domain-containing protein, partial [Bacteroidales bacterium]|nr:DAK2 domain-containing protein [Bacteroidales bacterium]
MRIDAIDGSLWKKMLEAGSASLYASRKTINDLNVFPIPDGDTGDNMYLTISSGCSAAADTEGSLGAVATAAGRGMLLGARGNSGVILSRIFAGVAKGFGDAENVDAEGLSRAMESGVKEAYAAVGQPVEGTILTVFREGVEQARKSGACDISAWFSAFLDEMRASLDRTPDLLPVLAEAGVVDSGGAGFLVIASGMKDALEGRVTESETQVQENAAKSLNIDAFGADDELRFGYCTEFLLRLQNAKVGDAENCDISEIRDWLDSVGESVVCFRDGSIVKVHVHTMDPGAILSHARRWGEFLSVKVE